MKEMPAGRFKSHCLAVMDQVQQTGESVVITKHGKPVAKLVPVRKKGDDLLGSMLGKFKIVGDIVSPVAPLDDWESK